MIGPGNDFFSVSIIWGRMNNIDPEIKPLEQGIDCPFFGRQAQLASAETNHGYLKLSSAKPSILHPPTLALTPMGRSPSCMNVVAPQPLDAP